MINSNKVTIYCQNWLLKDFQYFLYTVALYLKENYGYKIRLVENEEFINIAGKDTRVLDCQLLIHYEDLDIIKALCYCDSDSPMSGLIYTRNNPNDVFIQAQNGTTLIRNYDEYQYKFKFIPLNYLPEATMVSSLDNFYLRRRVKSEFIDKMVFRGNVNTLPRTSPKYLEGNEYFEGSDYLAVEHYFNSLTDLKVGLSIPGVGEICHRDIEYMAIGIPFIKFQYITKWNPELIPNYHYISIDRIDDETNKERLGSEEHAKLYLQKFLEVKDNKEFLSFISKNVRKYYEDHLHPLTRLHRVIKLLEI